VVAAKSQYLEELPARTSERVGKPAQARDIGSVANQGPVFDWQFRQSNAGRSAATCTVTFRRSAPVFMLG
jgi:hypothetical protein